jgi:hypothetical protein
MVMKATLRKATDTELVENNDEYAVEPYIVKIGNRKIFTDLGDELIELLDSDVKRIEVSDKPFNGCSEFTVERDEVNGGFKLNGKNQYAWACEYGMRKVYAKLRR